MIIYTFHYYPICTELLGSGSERVHYYMLFTPFRPLNLYHNILQLLSTIVPTTRVNTSMSPFLALLLQCIGMLLGTLLCGNIPLHLPLSKTKLRVLEVMGAGLLVGASMTVVLPEGVSALFKTPHEPENHLDHLPHAITRRAEHNHGGHHQQDPESMMGFALLGGFLLMFLLVLFR
jgi:hypothetical protein